MALTFEQKIARRCRDLWPHLGYIHGRDISYFNTWKNYGVKYIRSAYYVQFGFLCWEKVSSFTHFI